MEHHRGLNEGHLSSKRLPAASLDKRVLTFACLALLLLSSYAGLLSAPAGDDDILPSDQAVPARTTAISGVEFKAVPSWAHVGDPITFYANASTDVGSTLNFTINYDSELADGSPNPYSPISVNVTGTPGNVVTTYTYDHEGNLTNPLVEDPFFKVKLTIFDGYTTKTETRIVYIVGNVAPAFVKTLSALYDKPDIGVEYNYSVKLIDADGDSLNVTWDFGDGTPLVYNETGPAGTEVFVNQTHVWNPYFEPGAEFYEIVYYLNLTVTDGQGNYVNSTSEVLFEVDLNFGPEGTFWASAKKVDPTVVVWFYANATDKEGESITWTFVFEKEGEDYYTEVHRTNASEPSEIVWMNISHVFAVEGNYSVTLYLTDALLPELQVGRHNNSLGTINVTSELNVVPYVMSTMTVTPSPLKINESNPIALARIYTEVADWDGDVLTATWDFGDGSEQAVNVTNGGKQIFGISQLHEYASSGYFNVTISVTDGWFNHTVIQWKIITVTSDNRAPVLVDIDVLHTNGSYSTPGSAVGFVIKLMDYERDSIEITWSFGDNTEPVTLNLTDFDYEGVVTCEVNHTFATVGEYRIRIVFTDHMFDTSYHNTSLNVTVRIRQYDAAIVEPWDVWDYVGLGLLFGMFGSIAFWAVYANVRRKKLDRWGLTWDEYMIRKNEIKLSELGDRDDKGGPGGGKA